MNALRTTIVLTFVVAASAIVLEAIARWVLYSPVGYTETGTPRQGFSIDAKGDWVPDQEAVWIDRLELPFFVHINSDGFRNLEPVDPNADHVLVLGDSQTFGLFVSSHDIWTRTAQRVLNIGAERRVQLLNTGLPGSTIIDHRDYLRDKGARVDPDFVLFTVYQNDLSGLNLMDTSIGSTRADMRAHSISADDSNYAFRRFLNDHLAVYSLARAVKNHFQKETAVEEVEEISQPKQAPKQNATVAGTPSEITAPPTRNAKRYTQLFEESLAEVRELSAKPLVIYIPTGLECSSPSQTALLAQELASRNDAPYLDLNPSLCQYETAAVFLHDTVGDGSDYAADSHLSRFGHILVGRAVAAFLAQNM